MQAAVKKKYILHLKNVTKAMKKLYLPAPFYTEDTSFAYCFLSMPYNIAIYIAMELI